MSLSTIIVTWNAEGHIKKCLESLLQYGPKDNQIIVIDNASSDRTIEEVKHLLEKADIRLMMNRENLGLGHATRQAYEKTRGDLVLVANPDIVFTSGLETLLRYSDDHLETEYMMPALHYQGNSGYKEVVNWRRFPFYKQFFLLVYLDRFHGFLTRYCLGDRTVFRTDKVDQQHSYGMSCVLMRRNLIERIGGIYRSEYFLYWADGDLLNRMIKHAARCSGVPDASVDHYGAYSATRLNPRAVQYLYGRGQKQYEKDWGHSSRYFVAYLLDDIVLAIYEMLHGRIRSWRMDSKLLFLKGWLSI